MHGMCGITQTGHRKVRMAEAADVVIVGAGLSGLNAAQVLQQAEHTTILLDKGRRAGGRLATKEFAGSRADHGAQFFSVRSSELRQRVEAWAKQGLVYEWSRGWSDGSIQSNRPDGYPRYAVRGGMNQLAQHLAHGLDVRPSTRVSRLEKTVEGWVVYANAYPFESSPEQAFRAKAILLTPPVPQSLALLDSSDVVLPDSQRQALENIEYGPCLAGLFKIEGVLGLPYPGALQRHNATFSWIADNQRKGVSPDVHMITVHASPDWSREHYRDDPDDILDAMWQELVSLADADIHMKDRLFHRWGYSIPLVTHDERVMLAEGVPPLIFAGDAFGGPRVEGAFLSGLAAGTLISQQLQSS